MSVLSGADIHSGDLSPSERSPLGASGKAIAQTVGLGRFNRDDSELGIRRGDEDSRAGPGLEGERFDSPDLPMQHDWRPREDKGCRECKADCHLYGRYSAAQSQEERSGGSVSVRATSGARLPGTLPLALHTLLARNLTFARGIHRSVGGLDLPLSLVMPHDQAI